MILLMWLIAELVLLGDMIALLVLGHPQGLTLIILMIAVMMMAGQAMVDKQHRERDRR